MMVDHARWRGLDRRPTPAACTRLNGHALSLRIAWGWPHARSGPARCRRLPAESERPTIALPARAAAHRSSTSGRLRARPREIRLPLAWGLGRGLRGAGQAGSASLRALTTGLGWRWSLGFGKPYPRDLAVAAGRIGRGRVA